MLFQRLSIFAGPFDVAAALRVAADDVLAVDDIDDLLGDLAERSMLIVESGPSGRCFRLLETMREFAAEQLDDDGSSDLIAGRHARWCLDEVTLVHQLLVGPAEVDGVTRLVRLWPNLRAAVDRACATGDRGLAGSLVRPVASELNLRRQSEIGDWAERILALTPPADDEQIIYWLGCAAEGQKQIGDRDGYERLVHRYGEPDHPLLRNARAKLYDDGEALVASSPEAVAWLRRHGEDHMAALTEIGGAAGLLSTGRFSELDVVVTALADRYRIQGPPTLLYVALTLLGYSAFFQGTPDLAEQLFEESAVVVVPNRTISVNEPVEARAAFRRGNRLRAFWIFRSHVDDLLRTDYTDIAGNAAVEFINMMAAIDRLLDAGRMMGYLATTGDFGALASRILVADAAAMIAAAVGHTPDTEQLLDARHALEYMRDVLVELTDDRQVSH